MTSVPDGNHSPMSIPSEHDDIRGETSNTQIHPITTIASPDLEALNRLEHDIQSNDHHSQNASYASQQQDTITRHSPLTISTPRSWDVIRPYFPPLETDITFGPIQESSLIDPIPPLTFLSLDPNTLTFNDLPTNTDAIGPENKPGKPVSSVPSVDSFSDPLLCARLIFEFVTHAVRSSIASVSALRRGGEAILQTVP
ncbi:hypothetical protein BLNAU_1597 [Blattamonas nauphoetae]|uniref:Uncharacterized protein n=1 Tax=Blattamonas nauphoetae TaxID=2049346 RepID=A0ABQ9YIH1_9EUKA|nr:hypothetical protein BLNAU_1597 [Blattamonas nauphoetae]